MYTSFQLAKKFLEYFLHASNGKGHGVHSPFVYDFIIHVLNKKGIAGQLHFIEDHRRSLLKNNQKIEVEDFGAGSAVISTNTRVIKDIAKSSPKSKKFARLLFRIASYYKCKTIVELGTSFGTTTAYLSLSSPEAKVFTLEGAGEIADRARAFFSKNDLHNIDLLEGSFDKTIPQLLNKLSVIDLLFIDGNHQEKATLEYFEQFLKNASDESIFIFDDIHWSAGMERAWETIKAHGAVTLSIDLFFIGIVFFRKEFLVKQHFSIRF